MSEQPRSAETELFSSDPDHMVGKAHVKRAQAARQGAGECNVAGPGQGISILHAPLIEREPLPVICQQAGDDGAPVLFQRHAMARSPVGVENPYVQDVRLCHGHRMSQAMAWPLRQPCPIRCPIRWMGRAG